MLREGELRRMRQGLRSIAAVLALVLGLHVLMLAGLDNHHARMPAGGGMGQMAAAAPAGALAEAAAVGHDMAIGCLAVLAGMILLAGSAVGGVRRWTRAPRCWPAPRAAPPPAPPPIALGISRT